MRDGPHVTPSTLTVVIGLAGFAFGSLSACCFVVKANFARDVAVLVSYAVIIGLASLTTSVADVRIGVSVAPATRTVIVSLAGLKFLSLSAFKSRLLASTVYTAVFAPIALVTKSTSPSNSSNLIIAADVRDGMNVAPVISAVSIGITGITGLSRARSDLVTAADMGDSPHIAPGAFAVIVGCARSTFCCFRRNKFGFMIGEDHHSVAGCLEHLYAC